MAQKNIKPDAVWNDQSGTMEQSDQKETPELAWSSHETTTINISQNIIIWGTKNNKKKKR